MQVVTLTQEDLDAHAGLLADAVMGASPTHYDAVIGVKRGGSIVCDAFLRHFPQDLYAGRYDVALQRPSTRHKKGLGTLLRRLPYPILNAMRKAEARMLTLRRKIYGPQPTAEARIPDSLAAVLTLNERPEILLIDDAIDSGDTLYAIENTLRKMNPETKITVAVITETTDKPRIRANHTLYRNKTLIRFPWSDDYKTPKKPLKRRLHSGE